MPQIITNGSFDPAVLQVDDLYILITPPPAGLTGVPTDIVGVVGTAPWGAVNVPQLLGNPQNGAASFGGITAASVTDAHDLPTEIALLFAQAPSQAQLQVWANRVVDGTDAPAQASVNDAATTSKIGGVAVAIYTGSAPNGAMQMTISLGSKANAFNVVISGFPGLPGETFPNIANASGSFWQNLANALQNGISGVRGPSNFARFIPGTPTVVVSEVQTVTPTPNGTAVEFSGTLAHHPVLPGQGKLVITDSQTTPVSFYDYEGNGTLYSTGGSGTINYQTGAYTLTYTVAPPSSTTWNAGYTYMVSDLNAPAPGSYVFAGGTDGRTGVNSAILLGSATALPPTGLYALGNLNPVPGMVYLAGNTDTTTIASLSGFADSTGLAAAYAFATGTTSQAAVTAKQSAGVEDWELFWLKDWVYFFDQVNNQVRLVPPYSTILGRTATLPPQDSPGNKQVYGIQGTERNSPFTGNIPYSIAEIGLLESNGIMFITNPIPAGSMWGIRHGQNGYPVPPQDDVPYTRMTNFIAQSLASFLGRFVDQNQTKATNDPLRDAVKGLLNAFFQNLVDLGQIDSSDGQGGPGYLVVCDLTNNSAASISQRYLFASARTVYLSNVRFFVMSLQGGTTVVTSGNSLSEALIGQPVFG